VEIECPDDMYEMVEKLLDAGVGMMFVPIVIRDSELADKMEKAGLIMISASGKAGATEKLCENGEEILSKIGEAMCQEGPG
jgi:hypothetical protein